MHQNKRGCIELQRTFHNFAWINRNVINGSLCLLFVRNQDVFAVQKQYAKLLDGQMRHCGLTIIQKRLPTG